VLRNDLTRPILMKLIDHHAVIRRDTGERIRALLSQHLHAIGASGALQKNPQSGSGCFWLDLIGLITAFQFQHKQVVADMQPCPARLRRILPSKPFYHAILQSGQEALDGCQILCGAKLG